MKKILILFLLGVVLAIGIVQFVENLPIIIEKGNALYNDYLDGLEPPIPKSEGS